MTITARQKKLRTSRAAAALTQLQAHFPVTFPVDDAAIVPLTIGLREELSAWLDQHPELPRTDILSAMQRHCSRATYQRTVMAGSTRFHLNGEPDEPVTLEGQARAEQRLAQIQAERQAAVERQAAKPKPTPAISKAPQSKPKPKPAVIPPSPAKPSQPTVVVKKRRTIVKPE